MKFIFPDSLDLVDPSFNFETETRNPNRVRQQQDIYPHELFAEPPYDGMLVSKAVVDGSSEGGSGKYTIAQRQRLLRGGVREFLRLDRADATAKIQTMGDCGGFSYVRQTEPPYTVDEVIDFYTACGFDFGVSVDHVILGYRSPSDPLLLTDNAELAAWRHRQEITLRLAKEFLSVHVKRRCRFVPVGVAQGWSPASYAESVEELQKMGYDHVAIGGLVPLKSHEILEVLSAIAPNLRGGVKMHLFGVTRCDHVRRFKGFGATSFDSTSPFRQAFKDDKDNYHTPTRPYTAIRVPQVEANPTFKKRILAGLVKQDLARELECACMTALIGFDRGTVSLDETLDLLTRYECLHDGKIQRTEIYREVLRDQPWKQCECDICRKIGIHAIIFRGAERNRRRGFHNLWVFKNRLRRELITPAHPELIQSQASGDQ